MPARTLTALTVVAALVAPAAARAGIFPGEVIDGPNADIVSLGDLDVARDGTGAVGYVKRDTGVDHIFASRLADGSFQPPERIDTGLDTRGSQPAIAASDGGRVVVAFVNAGTVYASVRPAGATAFPAPQPLGPGSDPAADMSINGAAYVTWSSNGDIRAARLDRTATSFAVIDAPLDVDPAQPAGDAPTRVSDVAISADGTGLATWGERGADGRVHVYARRLFGMSVSTAPQDLTVDDFQGHPGGSADAPHVQIEDDSSFAWVTYRQELDGVQRVLARRLIGSQFDPPQLADGMAFPADEPVDAPSFAMSGRGLGLAATARSTSNTVWVAPLEDDAFGKGATRADAVTNVLDPQPIATFAENADGFVTWLQSTGPTDTPSLFGRIYDNRQGLQPITPISNAGLGAVDQSAGYDAAGDRANDVAVVAIQGSGGDRQLIANMVDRPPAPSGTFVGHTTQKYRRPGPLSWAAAFDLWGPLQYTVVLDGQPLAQTGDTTLTPPQPIPDGQHRWRVVATDHRGQTLQTPTRLLQVDGTPPTVAISVSGTRRARQLLTFRFPAGDVDGSGLARVRVEWGDGTSQFVFGPTTHRYPAGSYVVRASATDKAGNVTVVTKPLTVKKPKRPKHKHRRKHK